MSKNIKERLANLRNLFNIWNIEGYVVPSSDEYQNPYVPNSAKRLKYITGFSGSNGIAIILRSKVLFFTDSRYISQAHIELDTEEFEIYNLTELQKIVPSITIGLDDMLFVERQIGLFSNATIKFISENLVDKIWHNKPSEPATDVFLYPLEYSGLSTSDKILRLRQKIQDKADYILLTKPETICWLLNIRASDILFCPVMLGRIVLSEDKIWLFTNLDRNYEVIKQNCPEIIILNNSELKHFLSQLQGKVMLDSNSASIGISSLVKQKVIAEDPSMIMKACKEDAEIAGFCDIHVKDAIALCEVLANIENGSYGSNITEYDISLKLTAERQKQQGYITDSFPSIVGYKGNGAIIHYSPKSDFATIIGGDGILLVDSGAHYFGGSTDVTRTIKIGSNHPTDEQKRRYTQVLKGHIALAKVKFREGVTGAHLNILAHMYLWEDGVDFDHGTGHGVGNALFVHEGPQNISNISNVALRENMVLSNEPGFYKNGEYGIRIENLLYVTRAKENGFLEFKQLTLVPYCKNLVEVSLLSRDEIEYLSSYQFMIMEKIYPYVSDVAKAWIKDNMINL